MEKKRITWPYRVILFLMLVCLTLNAVSGPLIYPYDDRTYGWTHALYEEKPGTMDVVFVGNSNTFMFWMPLQAWQEYGIASCNYAIIAQRIESYRYLIEEARKTQPDALYVVTIGKPVLNITVPHAHHATDYMHHSLTRLRLILAYAKYNSFIPIKQAELIFPLLRYHFRWDELTSKDFARSVFAKGATVYNAFLNKISDISESVSQVTERGELGEQEEEVIRDLLDYLDQNRVHVLFLSSPQFEFTEDVQASLNTLLDLIEARGYPVLRTQEKLDEIGFDFTQDYYNVGHTNIHGAAKYTEYVARYLLENYELPDRRNDPDYADFDTAYEEYMQVVSPHIFDIEICGTTRTKELPAPELLSAKQNGESITISWGVSSGADGYLIYRKSVVNSGSETIETAWENIAVLDGEQLSYMDSTTIKDAVYYYTVVPFRYERETNKDDIQIGRFNYKGISMEKSALSLEDVSSELSLDDEM